MTDPVRGSRVVVIGGGIAGLTAALTVLRERPSADVTVYEGAPSLGGKLKLGEVAGRRVDLGAESILNKRPEGVELAAEVGLGDRIVHPTTNAAGIWTRGAVRPLPRTLMGIPADLAGAVRSGIVSRAGGLRAGIEPWLPAPSLEEDVSVGAFVSRRLGSEIRDRLVEPMLGGVYAGRSDDISLHAALPQVVAAVGESGSLLRAAQSATAKASTSSSPVFAGLDGGVATLATATAVAIRAAGGAIETDATVRELAPAPGGWRLVVGPTAEPRIIDADQVIVAVPARPASRLLGEAVPAAAHQLAGIEYASMAIVTVAFDAERVPSDLTGSGFLVPPVDRRVVKAVTFSSTKWTWLADDIYVLRCSVGRAGEEAALQLPDTELVEAAMLDLRDAVGLHTRLLDAQVTRWGGALPQYAVGHLDRVQRIREAVEAVPGLELCGAAYEGVGIPAVVATARRAATRVAAAMGPPDTMDA